MRRFLFISLFTCVLVFGQEMELRGTWFAWAGADVPTKAEITEQMEALAAAHFNLVYFDVWRYGYPYYQSQVFEDVTGITTDPALPEGRDILMEAIAEAHRVGLQLEAWFEFGFVASVGYNDHVWEALPEWFAMKQNGSTDFEWGFKWLSHCNRDAQEFLISLCTEVARNYDVDGIELDRIRYPGLDCGYDSATVALYASEHNGNEPPTFTANAGWMRWRADKLTAFMADCYDSVKAVNPDLMVSNAPIVYSYGYTNFCQDWRPWINDGYLDNVAPQVYRATNASYVYDLDIQRSYVNNQDLLYPGITTMVNTSMVDVNEFLQMIESTRARGLEGHVIWYHLPVITSYAEALVDGPYAEPALMPGRDSTWRRPPIVISELDTGVTYSGTWTPYTSKGFGGSCQYSLAEDVGSSVSYTTDITQAGWYEVYLFINSLWNAAVDAGVVLYHADGETPYRVDQSQSGIEGWYKLDDIYLNAGDGQTVCTINNNFTTGAFVFADAIMLMNSNRVGLTPPVGVDHRENVIPRSIQLSAFPNPFNGMVSIRYSGDPASHPTVSILDLKGRKICSLGTGTGTWQWNGQDADGRAVSSGIYLVQLQLPEGMQFQKIVLAK